MAADGGRRNNLAFSAGKVGLMKILQINNVYDFGSTGKITRDIHQGLLERGYDSVVYYGRRYKTGDQNVHKICSELYGKAQNGIYQITGIKYGGCYISTNRIIRAIKEEKPDIVHLQCLNGHFVNIYRLIAFLKENKIPTVLTLHAEFMYTGGCSHSLNCDQWKSDAGCGNSKCPLYGKELKSRMGDRSAEMWHRMKTAFDGFERLVVVSVSPWLMERAKVSPILGGYRHQVIFNGLDTEIFQAYEEQDLKEIKVGLGYRLDDKIVFHASPSFNNDPNSIKGGYYVLKLAERMKDVQFLVAGRHDESMSTPSNVRLLGNITDKTYMAKLYAMADVTLLTSKRETFSMVCAESLCCGTPVVGFIAGAPEMISIPSFSDFCAYGDIDALQQAINTWLMIPKSDKISTEAVEIYDSELMVKKYLQVYQELVCADNSKEQQIS